MEHERLLENLFNAYYDARCHKRKTVCQLKFEMDMEKNLIELAGDIENRRYKVGRSMCFIVMKPVKREVFAATFRDRIVHHLLYNYLSPLFERTFIEDCYSCRKGYGTLYGIERTAKHIRSCTQNYSRDAYILKLDLSGYFMSINRNVLLDKLMETMDKYADRNCGHGRQRWREYLDYDMIKYLLRSVTLNNPIKDCMFRGDMKEWEGLPRNKSLFYSKADCGLPIGNLTSQLFSNIYLTEFDQYMKRKENLHWYGRYVDDIVVIHRDKRFLVRLTGRIEKKLTADYGVSLHPECALELTV